MNKLIKQAFTLIELLVVIAIIGILSGLIVVSMSGVTQKANIAKAQVFSNSLRNSLMANIVGEWKFDDITNYTESGGIKTIGTTSNNISDSWNGNHGTASGGPALKEGNDCVSGKCILFDGSNDYVDLGNDKFNYQQFTISHWIKTSTYPVTPFSNYYRQAAGQPEYGWFTTIRPTGRPSIQINASSYTPAGGPLVNDNMWHLVTITVNGLNAVFYTDGVQVSSYAYPAIPSYAVSVETYIGAKYEGAVNGSFSGLVDDVRVFNSVILNSQIQEQYYIGLNKLFMSGGISREEYLVRIIEVVNSVAEIK
ncbi:MAG: LamG-like jellyroll fold domain-containing protein [Candidatus Paceibacterota bacterium]|jgi:prepilin-type N-terminal cleavage/methylation domain-containing protein